jgi:hypothetical protein
MTIGILVAVVFGGFMAMLLWGQLTSKGDFE